MVPETHLALMLEGPSGQKIELLTIGEHDRDEHDVIADIDTEHSFAITTQLKDVQVELRDGHPAGAQLYLGEHGPITKNIPLVLKIVGDKIVPEVRVHDEKSKRAGEWALVPRPRAVFGDHRPSPDEEYRPSGVQKRHRVCRYCHKWCQKRGLEELNSLIKLDSCIDCDFNRAVVSKQLRELGLPLLDDNDVGYCSELDTLTCGPTPACEKFQKAPILRRFERWRFYHWGAK